MFAMRLLVLSCCLGGSLTAAAQAVDVAPAVAGLKPDRRPEGAPVVRMAPVDTAGKGARLTGISQPWPGNVERVAEQGSWYSPMFRPGMPGPYDLRGWHGTRQR